MSGGAGPGAETPDGAQLNIARDQARQYIVQHGDLHVGGPPNYRVDEFRPPVPGVPQAMRRQPSRLLAARHQVVDFTGRERELAELAGWRDDPELGLAVLLVHGPGGQGKTRLAAHFAQQSADLGWTVAHAAHRTDGPAAVGGPDAARVAGSPGLLLIVDYAERWPVGDLLALAQDPLLRTGAPTRVLLLSRPAGGWWDSLAHRLADRFNLVTDQLPLTALADGLPARTAVFTAARDRFAELLGVPDPGRIPTPTRLGEDAYGLVLTVHMAALAAVEAHARGDTPPADPAALSAYLLTRERDHWRSMYDNDQRIRTPPEMLARAVFTATLTRPLPYPDGVAALRRAGIPSPEQALDDHRLCYPPADPATVCEPLYPDRLGEDFLALCTPGHPLTSYQPDPLADTAVARLLTGAGDADGEQQVASYAPQLITVLIETAHRWPHIGLRQLFPLLRERPELALSAGGVALTRLAELPDVDLDVLAAIEPLLPEDRHVGFDIPRAAITTRLTTHRLAATSDPADRARLYVALGYRLAHAGRRVEALAATSEAVEVYRRLVGVNPAAFEPDLAGSLWSFARVRAGGQVELAEALSAAEESVGIYERLVERLPQAFTGGLRGALGILARVLEQLDCGEEAVRVRRRIEQLGDSE